MLKFFKDEIQVTTIFDCYSSGYRTYKRAGTADESDMYRIRQAFRLQSDGNNWWHQPQG